MTFTTELFLFEPTDAFNDDPNIVVPALKLVLDKRGVDPTAFYGKQVENTGKGYVFLNWDSYESHQTVINSPASYGPIGEALKPSLGDNPKVEIYHVIFSGPTLALEQPVTAVLILTLNSPENRAAVVEILLKTSETSENLIVFGQTCEDENKYILIGGWPSVEAHVEMAARPEVKATLSDTLFSLANKDHLYHTKLLRCTKS